jgi:multidrug efflux system membrane fusion protein
VTAQLRWIFLALAAIGPSSSVLAQQAAAPATPPASGAPAAPAAPAGGGVPVTVTKPIRQNVPVYLRGLGLVAASKTVIIRPRVDGTIDRVAFTEGDELAAGALIAQLDPRPYQAVLDQALARKASDEATLANARLDLRRSTQLASNQFAAQQTVDTRAATVAQMEANIKGDEASVSAARLNLEFTRITAPFDGRVGLRLVDPGNFVRAADNTSPGIVSLSQIRPISVTFTVAQDYIPEITAAMAHGKPPVVAWSADDKVKLAEGELLTIDNAIDATTGTIKVKASFSNADNKLWPGQFVNARLLVNSRSNALTVPSSAVQRGPAGMFVYVVKADQTVIARPIEVAQDTGSISVVSTGLADDETIVLSGQSRLNNGARVAATAAPAS